jgi:endonuclease YncB( thermonuclease family)
MRAGLDGARVEYADWRDIAEAMLATGLARPYDGGKRAGWCGARRQSR